MATIYLLIETWVTQHPIHGPNIDSQARAFSNPDVRAAVTRRRLDEALHELEAQLVSDPHALSDEVLDVISDMRFARKANDLSYEMLCCPDALGFKLDFHNVHYEHEEEIVCEAIVSPGASPR